MISVVGHWETGWNVPLIEAPLWSLPLRDFGVTDWRMWPVSGVQNGETDVRLREFATLQEALVGLEEVPWVFLEPPNRAYGIAPSSLVNLEHPEGVAYIFGSAHFNPVVAGLPRAGDVVVALPTVQNAGVLWPHQVLVAALYDRMVKSWRS